MLAKSVPNPMDGKDGELGSTEAQQLRRQDLKIQAYLLWPCDAIVFIGERPDAWSS